MHVRSEDRLIADVDLMPGELADLVAEHLVWCESSRDRAAAMYELVRCAVDAVRWRLEPRGDPTEEASLTLLLTSAHDHYLRMTDVRST